ncbi:MAG TPA: prepilin-type N-terminal cleavage/methylation domain-containing protein [Candidatus Paceibacterota bacterium]
MKQLRSGQSFVELMIAIAIGAIFLGGMATIIAPSLLESGQAGKIQVAATNAQSLLNNVRVWSEGNWNNILSLATGTANQYYLVTSSSPYTATSGIQSIVIATTTYTDYFYVGDVYRSGGVIATTSTGNTYDPSTKQIFAVYNWTPHGVTSTISTYVTRNNDQVFSQTDWSGGPNASSAVTSTNNQFTSSSNIDYASTTGAIYVNL